MANIISEARADLESGLAKALGGGKLTVAELNELENLTVAEMMTEHGIDSIMAEKVVLHAQSERYRMNHQRPYARSQFDDDFEAVGGYNRTHPITETSRGSKRRMRALVRKVLRESRSNRKGQIDLK